MADEQPKDTAKTDPKDTAKTDLPDPGDLPEGHVHTSAKNESFRVVERAGKRAWEAIKEHV